MIKNVVFDIGNVLIGFNWRKYVHELFEDEIADRVAAALWRSGWWPELDRAVIPVEEILSHFCEADPGVKEHTREAFYRIGECVARIDWVIPMVEKLKERGYNVYYLSNMSEHVMRSNPEAFDFTEYMDGGVFSCDVRLIKPDYAIYTALLDKYDLVPEECIFIDDHPENISAGRKLGMKGIVFRSPEQLNADLDRALTKDSTHDKITVLCFGDSNTYGYDPETTGRYPSEKRWPNILAGMLGDRYEVISEGLNGRTTAYDRPGAAWKNGISSFTACLGTHKPVDYVVIMLGTNDCVAGLGLTAEGIAEGMEALVNMAEDVSPELQGYIPEIIVTTPAAIGEDNETSPFAFELTPEAVRYSRDIEPFYRAIAEKHQCRYVDASGSAEISEEDSLHLSLKGHQQLAELMFRCITE